MAQSTVQDWGQSTWAYLSERWQELVVPTLVLLGVSMVAAFALVGGMVIFAASFSLARESELYPLLGGLVGFLVVLLAIEAMQPLILGYIHGLLRSMRGEGFPLSELRWGYGRSLSVVALVFLQSTATVIGFGLCVVPGVIASVLLSFAMTALADRDRGAIDALSTSIRLVRGRMADVFIWALVTGFVILLLASIPLVGNLVAVPVARAMAATAYLFLAKEVGEGGDDLAG